MKKMIMVSIAVFLLMLMGYVRESDDQPQDLGCKRIGLCVMATGKYINYVDRLLDSADTHFMPGHDVTYFVFTNNPYEREKTEVVFQEQMGWPYDSMMRFHAYYKHHQAYKDFDYMYALDADMLFVDTVADEVLFDRVGTILSGFEFERKPYEGNPLSTAHVNAGQGRDYFAGAFYGGRTKEFITLVKTCADNVDIDLARGYIAGANDESHLNKYFVLNPPTKVLSPSYCHFDHLHLPYPKKILAFEKGGVRPTVQSTLSPLAYYKRMLKGELS